MAAATALEAASLWLLAELAWRDLSTGAAVWLGVTRLTVFVTIAVIVARLRDDQAELRALNERLHRLLGDAEELARTDALTGLANSRAFQELLRRETRRRRETGEPLCLAYLDLDNFKLVNDHYGHAAGDEVLRAVAQALRERVRGSDVLARLGGDEFAVLLRDLRREAVEEVARRLVACVQELGEAYPKASLGASAGVAWLDPAPEDGEEAIRRADHAMYEAKAKGKGTIVVTAAATQGSGGR